MKKIFMLVFLGVQSAYSQSKPNGMFVMENASCAGLKFNSETSVTFVNESGCEPWELRSRWIDEKTFVLVEKEKVQQNCPPRTMLFKVVSFDGKLLKLKEIWTGWGNYADEVTVYRKSE